MPLAIDIFHELWETLCEMAPYLIFGFLMAGVLSVVISQELIRKHMGHAGFGSIFKASLLGVPLPLCSCSVIPVATSLRQHGASKGATTAFLLSTPQTGVDSIMATLALLGPVFAVFRPLAAFVSGLIGGTIVEALNSEKKPNNQDPCQEECCTNSQNRSVLSRIFRYGFVVLPRDIAGPLLIGLLIAGMISVFVPETFFSEFLGKGIIAMLVMMLMGIPVYVCATASIPVAAAMMMKGVTPGAALVFLMTGPATNAAAIIALWHIMGKRTTIIYLLVVAGTSLASGILLDFFFEVSGVSYQHTSHWMMPETVRIASAFILLGVLSYAIISKHLKKRHHGGCDCG